MDRLRETLSTHAPSYYEGKKTGDKEQSDNAISAIGLDTLGMDCIGNGGGRNVFDMTVLGHPDKCLKLAIPHPQYDGKRQNRREAELWASLSSAEKEFLVPVLEHGPEYHWLIMPQGDPVSTVPYQWRQDAKFHLSDDVWAKDMSTDNIVKLEGTYKLCDYGTPPQ